MARTSSPKSPRPSFQEGVDSIWKFQLRKENAVLLEKQEAQQKILQALAAESTQARKDFDERYSALEARISNLEHDERKDRHAFETWGEEMTSLKSQMAAVMEKQERQIWEAQAAASIIDRPSSRMSTAESTDVPTSSSRPATTITTTPFMHQFTSMNASRPNVATLMRAPVTNTTLHITNHNADKAFGPTGPMTRSRSGSGSLSHEPAPAPKLQDQTSTPAPRPRSKAAANTTSASASSSYETVKIPRLHQGTRSLKAYHNSATTIWESLREPKDQKLEIQFIALFIKGMGDEDKRQILVAELQLQHQSRTKKDGKVEILCKWKDVGQGMKDADLMSMSAGPKKKHRN